MSNFQGLARGPTPLCILGGLHSATRTIPAIRVNHQRQSLNPCRQCVVEVETCDDLLRCTTQSYLTSGNPISMRPSSFDSSDFDARRLPQLSVAELICLHCISDGQNRATIEMERSMRGSVPISVELTLSKQWPKGKNELSNKDCINNTRIRNHTFCCAN